MIRRWVLWLRLLGIGLLLRFLPFGDILLGK